jgi:hypothetical protein
MENRSVKALAALSPYNEKKVPDPRAFESKSFPFEQTRELFYL